MLTYEAHSAAEPPRVWALLARPARWPEWAPHVRGAWGLGTPEVREGALGAARLVGGVPVPARVVEVRPGQAWTWRVGPVELVHRVRPDPAAPGSVVAIDVLAPPPLEAMLRVTYGPVVGLLIRRLARVAEAG
jgi:hypothetical protein